MTSRSSEPKRKEPARGAGKERLHAGHEDNRGRSLGFHAAGQPITKGSVKPYMGARGHAIPDDPRLAAWEQTMAWSAKAAMARAGLRPYDCPVIVSAEFRLPCPTSPAFSVPATAADKDKGGGDLDKLLRALGDALQSAGVVRDDSRISEYRDCIKRYADDKHPMGVTVTVTPLGKEDEQ